MSLYPAPLGRTTRPAITVIPLTFEYPRRALALEGSGIFGAASGEEATELLHDRTWDAMILEIS